MTSPNTQPSRANLSEFLDFAGDKGLMKKATATAYKKAASIILGIMDDTEAADLTRIDLEDVIYRHRNKAAGKIVPPTLKSYEMRTRAAVKNFLEYVKDPSTWKPGIQTRTSKSLSRTSSKEKAKAKEKVEAKEIPSERKEATKQPSIHIDFQIHISPESDVKLVEKVFESLSKYFPTK
jgi:hypothetical protein